MEGAVAIVTRTPTDLELVERHRHGDEEAFREIYQRFEGMVYNLALRMSGRPEDAEDLTQEVFLRIHRKLSGFRGASSLKTWVFRVALNCCRSRLRRRHRWAGKRIDSEGVLERVADPGRGPEQKALDRALGARLSGALREVPWVYREAVVLRDIQGLTYDEVAAVLGIRIGTVRSRIARGRERLRAAVEKLS